MLDDPALPSTWFDPGFDPENLPDYDMSVLAYRDGLVFIILRLGMVAGIIRMANIPRHLQVSDTAGLRSRFLESGLPEGSFHQIDLYYRDDRYTIIPEILSRENEPREILSMRHLIKSNETVGKWVKDDLACIFAGRPALEEMMEGFCRKLSVRSYGMLVVMEVLRLSGGKRDVLLADLGNRSLDIAIADSKGLQFCNAFSVRTAEDAAYHLLNVLREQADGQQVYLTGDFVADSRVSAMVLPYIKEPLFLSIDSGLRVPEECPGGSADLYTLLNQLR